MKRVHIEDNDGIEIVSQNGHWRLYVSLIELPGDENYSHAFHVVSDKTLAIQPRSDNSILVLPAPLNEAQAKRASKR